MNVLFPNDLLFRLLSVWNINQLRMSIFTLHVIFPLVPIQKSSAFWDNCLVYSTSLVSINYLGSNKCSVDNRFTFLAWMSCFHLFFCLEYCVWETLSGWECLYLNFTSFFPLFLFRKAVLSEITVLYTVLSSFQQLSRNKQLFCWK